MFPAFNMTKLIFKFLSEALGKRDASERRIET
jgi:hypothetical protein